MKKLIAFMLLGTTLFLGGCSTVNKAVNDMSAYEQESEYCKEGKKIWVLERGSEKGVTITSQVIGTCE